MKQVIEVYDCKFTKMSPPIDNYLHVTKNK